MNAVEFFNTVTRPNITAAVMAGHDYRLAVNAILSVDAAYGIMFEQLKDEQHPDVQFVDAKGNERRDYHFKNDMAKRSRDFKAVRDAAYAIKHGRLSGKEPRVVSSADDISSVQLVCGLFSIGERLGSSAVLILCENDKPERAWVLLRRVELFTDELMGDLGLGPLECPIPDYHDARGAGAALGHGRR